MATRSSQLQSALAAQARERSAAISSNVLDFRRRLDREWQRCTFIRYENGGQRQPDVIRFNMNPSAFTRKLSANYVRHIAPGASAGIAQFIKCSDQTITFDIYINSYSRTAYAEADRRLSESDGIKPQLAEYEALVRPQLDLSLSDNAQFVPPPQVVLTIGDRFWRGHVDEVSISETQYTEELVPTEATVSVTFTTDAFTFNEVLADLSNLRAQARRGT